MIPSITRIISDSSAGLSHMIFSGNLPEIPIILETPISAMLPNTSSVTAEIAGAKIFSLVIIMIQQVIINFHLQ